jgi:pimeloyl-ACP methyl ester carboxylesterase
MPEITLDQGTVRYTDTGGDGPPVVLVHGLLVDGTLWRDVVPALAEHFRVVVPDLPLGSHRVPLRPGVDLSPPGVGRLIADLLAALDLRDVTLVGNDTGGAMCQMVLVHHPERVGRVVLTNCDSHENFLPPAFRPMQWMARVPAAVWLFAQLTRAQRLLTTPAGYGLLATRTLDPDLVAGWTGPLRADPGVRRDVTAVLRGIDTRHTLDAAARLRGFPGPALLVWGARDRFFTPAHARRLAAEFGTAPDGGARLELLPDAATFVPLDAPAELSALVRAFVRGEVGSR